MKLLLFSDLHCDASAAHDLAARASDADLIVGAGDFANQRRGLEVCLPMLLETGQPFLLVPGNNESLDELRAACAGYSNAHVLHGQGITVGGVEFWGLGGGVPPTPFGQWSYDLSEDEARNLLSDCPRDAVLISHSPPQGALDVASSGQHLGSVAVREVVERTHPRLVVCGHVHNCAGQTARLGQALICNVGPEGMWHELI